MRQPVHSLSSDNSLLTSHLPGREIGLKREQLYKTFVQDCNSLNTDIYLAKRDYATLWAYFLLFSIYKLYKHFYIFQESFQVFKLQCFKFQCMLPLSEAYPEPTQTSKMELFAESRLHFLQKDSS